MKIENKIGLNKTQYEKSIQEFQIQDESINNGFEFYEQFLYPLYFEPNSITQENLDKLAKEQEKIKSKISQHTSVQ